MAMTVSCPGPQEYRRFVYGQLAPEEVERLAKHLETCDPCAQTVHGLASEDKLLETVREVLSTSSELPTGCVPKGLLERLTGVSRVSPDTTQDMTVAQAGAALEYDFLGPAQEPGEIGRLGPYRILNVLGAGGMGVVFQAEDVQLHRHLALKVIKPALAGNELNRQRFLREARGTAAVEHEHIVPIYQVGEDRGLPFLAMQLLQGETLDARLKRDGKLPIVDVLRIGREVAAGLAAAHQHDLIHRDIKPSNIWLEAGSDRVKIVDFGLARAVDDETHWLSGIFLNR